MYKKRIKTFIELMNKNNVTWIKASELKSPEDKYDDEFFEEIQRMGHREYLNIKSYSHTHDLDISLTSKGAFFGKEYIADYEDIFNDTVSLIGSENSSLTDVASISGNLKVPYAFVGAVFEDLANRNLVDITSGAGGIRITNFTERGIDYFSNLK